MKIRKITLSGIDEETGIDDLFMISDANRLVSLEWGVLLSPRRFGPRFPRNEWVNELCYEFIKRANSVYNALSGHLCGNYVYNLVNGDFDYWEAADKFAVHAFSRFQINFGRRVYDADGSAMVQRLKMVRGPQLIFGLDGVNDRFYDVAKLSYLDAVPLYDLSGGRGVTPIEWPSPRHDVFSGYAGGLSPDNLEEQLSKIEEVVGDRQIWIDAETGLRTRDQFDMAKVEKFVKIASRWA